MSVNIFRSLLFVILFIVGASQSWCQTNNPFIEARLQLVQEKKGDSIKSLSVMLSVINHSKEDVYIPKFGFFEINYYKKTATTDWREINIRTHDYYKKLTPEESVHPPYMLETNPVVKSYKKVMGETYEKNSKILTQYGKTANTKLDRWFFIWPLFLKAGEEIKVYSIYPIDYFLKENCQYRIAFNSENRGAESRTAAFLNNIVKLPEIVEGYKLYIPTSFISNDIYFTTLEVSP